MEYSYSYRRQARIIAYQILYQRALLGIQQESEWMYFQRITLREKDVLFCQKIIQNTWSNIGDIDLLIQKCLQRWKQQRLSNSMNALLRTATGELIYMPITANIVINENLEICKEFIGLEAVNLCNGVLDCVLKNSDTILSENNDI